MRREEGKTNCDSEVWYNFLTFCVRITVIQIFNPWRGGTFTYAIVAIRFNAIFQHEKFCVFHK